MGAADNDIHVDIKVGPIVRASGGSCCSGSLIQHQSICLPRREPGDEVASADHERWIEKSKRELVRVLDEPN